ncbi:hypothetical protein M433DRAFT_146132 [Acidomyces richmondensis BFW]|nr:hypothetical protein M433DRAFT_146132 [Acidomyces richmondensis BFW]
MGRYLWTLFSSANNYNADTVYECCIISKAFTALVFAELIDNGCFDYHILITKHLPKTLVESLVQNSTGHLIGHVTVSMLLSHNFGASQGSFPGYAGELPPVKDVHSSSDLPSEDETRFHENRTMHS